MPILKDKITRNEEFIDKFAINDPFEEEGGVGAFVFKADAPMKRFKHGDRSEEANAQFKSARQLEIRRKDDNLDICQSPYGSREWNEELLFLRLATSIKVRTGKNPSSSICTKCSDQESYDKCDQLHRFVLINQALLTEDEKELVERYNE